METNRTNLACLTGEKRTTTAGGAARHSRVREHAPFVPVYRGVMHHHGPKHGRLSELLGGVGPGSSARCSKGHSLGHELHGWLDNWKHEPHYRRRAQRGGSWLDIDRIPSVHLFPGSPQPSPALTKWL